MKPDFYIDCLEPGADNPKKHTPPPEPEPPEPEPPEGFVDNTVKVFRLNPDGSKGEFLGTMPAFPEGWDDPAKRKMTRNLRQQKNIEEEERMRAVSLDKEKMVAKARELMSQGRSMNKAAQELGVPIGTLAYWLKKDKEHTPTPEPAAAANQEPEQEKVESATQSVAQEEPEITVKDVLQYKLAQKEQHTLPQIWTESDKQLARKLKEDGLSMRQIADAMGFTYRQVKGFFERERAKQRKPNQNDVLSKYKVKWIRDVMLDDLDPGVQLRIVAAVQGLEI